MTKHAFIIAAALLLLSVHAGAQSLGFATSGQGDVEITADDGIEWDRLERRIRILGNATVTQSGMKLVSDRITADYAQQEGKNRLSVVTATGNVVITTAAERLTGDEAVYDPNREIAVLRGRQAKLEMEKGVLTADLFEYFRSQNRAVARGNVRMVAEDGTVQADTMVAHLTRTRTQANQTGISRLELFDNIVINNGSEIIKGDKGVYNFNKGTIVIEGNVVLQQGRNFLRGDVADVNLNTGISRLRSNPDSRIGGQIDPNTKQ